MDLFSYSSESIVVTASTVSFLGVPKNETASKFLTPNSDCPIYTTVTLHCFL